MAIQTARPLWLLRRRHNFSAAFSVIVQPVVEPMDRFAALVTKCPAVHLAGGWSRTICHVMQSRFLVDFRMINRINRTIGCPAMKLCINIFLSLEYFVACNELNSLMSIIFYRHLDICLLFVDISWKSWHPSLLISHRGVKTWFSASRSSPDTSAGELQ